MTQDKQQKASRTQTHAQNSLFVHGKLSDRDSRIQLCLTCDTAVCAYEKFLERL